MQFIILAGKSDIKCLGKAVAEIVAGAGLQGLTVMHHALNGVGFLCAVELLFIGLAASYYRHGKDIFHKVCVDLQHTHGLFTRFFRCRMHGMALLPEELSVAEEGTGTLFPAQYRAPLIIKLGQIFIGMNNILEMLTEKGLGSGTDAVALLQLIGAAHGNPGTLRGKALYMILFLLQKGLRDQHGHVYILMTCLLELVVQNLLYILPDRISVRSVYKHTSGECIVDQFRLDAHIGEPLGEIHVHIGDFFNFFHIVFCHCKLSCMLPAAAGRLL